MSFTSEFVPLELGELRRQAAVLKADGWRFMETHAALGDAGVDLYYAFMKDGRAVNYRISGVTKDLPVPSITDMFLAAFVFENEARELFGVDMRDIAIDFQGAMYAPAQFEPMTIISPEQKAAKEKAAKAAAAKAAKAAGAQEGRAQGAPASAAGRVFTMTPELQARLDKKLATMSPDKVAKVEAALAARKAEAQAAASGEPTQAGTAPSAEDEKAMQQNQPKAEAPATPQQVEAPKADAALEHLIAGMSAEKAAKVRAALDSGNAGVGDPLAEQSEVGCVLDGQLEQLIGLMDEHSAATVRAALARKSGE